MCSKLCDPRICSRPPFTFFINDLDSQISSSFIVKYADDVKLTRPFSRSPKQDSSIASNFRRIFLGSLNALITIIYPSISVSSFFGICVSDDFRFLLRDCHLDFSTFIKDLGVIVSSPFSFKHHIANAVNKAYGISNMIGLLKRVFFV